MVSNSDGTKSGTSDGTAQRSTCMLAGGMMHDMHYMHDMHVSRQVVVHYVHSRTSELFICVVFDLFYLCYFGPSLRGVLPCRLLLVHMYPMCHE